MSNFFKKFLQKISKKTTAFRITVGRGMGRFSKTREILTPESTDISRDTNADNAGRNIGLEKTAESCPYCNSRAFVKRGLRKKKLETVQLYLCGDCKRTFTAQFIKGKHFPMNLIIEGLNYYNLGFGLEETCKLLEQKFGVPVPNLSSVEAKSRYAPEPSTLANWIKEYSELCRYSRLRPFAIKMYKPHDVVEVMNMAHRQIYRFRYHRAKMQLVLQEFKNHHFGPLKEYLDAVSSETPHQYFQNGLRISEIKTKFNKAQMIIRGKHNYANELAKFVLQAVKENKFRHEALQRFFIANDSVTVASEVPVYIKKEDIEHMQNQLNFKVTEDLDKFKNKDGKILMTGHIDLLQVRNGLVHIIDFKPNAAKEKPIEQLTWYALALSRLTGLRLYEFKCGWFDEKDYFEFYPLHVVYKIKDRKKKKVRFKEGTVVEVSEEDKIRMV